MVVYWRLVVWCGEPGLWFEVRVAGVGVKKGSCCRVRVKALVYSITEEANNPLKLSSKLQLPEPGNTNLEPKTQLPERGTPHLEPGSPLP